MGSEKRQFPRSNIHCDVCIKIPVVGALLDVSRTGARLMVDDPNALPDEFMLALNPELHRWCRIVWRKDHEVGLIYRTAPAKYKDWFSGKPPRRGSPKLKAAEQPASL